MNKQAIIDAIAQDTNFKKVDIEEMIHSLVSNVTEALMDDEKVIIKGIGTFETRQRNARSGRNPKTGEILEVEASKTVGFKPSATLKDKLNEK
ncbi:HU family DNA-binding protein [Tannockella kyphosi]|uniref:HU family DNA-binding protein n=1 Tax=Tannockella kyphosi TaxID=2899121 RepID=UPI00201203B3|nr:HU family DNA-binding protein [Tannockella kyphosi]